MCMRPPSFTGTVVVFVRRRSPLLVGGRLHLCSWAFAFVRGWSCRWCGRAVGVVVPFVWCCGGRSVRLWVVVIAGGHIRSVVPLVGCSGGLVGCGGGGKLVGCGGGELVGCGSRPLVCGGGRSSWPFVVV